MVLGLVWAALLALLGAMMLVHQPAAILLIAAVMAGLVGWIFMHLRGAAVVVRLFAMGFLLWLVILFGALADWLTR